MSNLIPNQFGNWRNVNKNELSDNSLDSFNYVGYDSSYTNRRGINGSAREHVNIDKILESEILTKDYEYADYNTFFANEISYLYSYGEKQLWNGYREDFYLFLEKIIKIQNVEEIRGKSFSAFDEKTRKLILSTISSQIDTMITETSYNNPLFQRENPLIKPLNYLQCIIISDSFKIDNYHDISLKILPKEIAENKIEKELKMNILDLIQNGMYTNLVEYILSITSSTRDIENFRNFKSSQNFRISLHAIASMLELARRYPTLKPYKDFINNEVLDYQFGEQKESLNNQSNNLFTKFFYRLNLILEKFNSELKLSLPFSQIFAVIDKLVYIAFHSIGITSREHFNLKNEKRKKFDLPVFDTMSPIQILKDIKPIDLNDDVQNQPSNFSTIVLSNNHLEKEEDTPKRLASKTRPTPSRIIKSRNHHLPPLILNPEATGGQAVGLSRPGTPMVVSDEEPVSDDEVNSGDNSSGLGSDSQMSSEENGGNSGSDTEIDKMDKEKDNEIEKNKDDKIEKVTNGENNPEIQNVEEIQKDAEEDEDPPKRSPEKDENGMIKSTLTIEQTAKPKDDDNWSTDSDKEGSRDPNNFIFGSKFQPSENDINKLKPTTGSLQKDNLSIWPPLPLDGTELCWNPKVSITQIYKHINDMYDQRRNEGFVNFFPKDNSKTQITDMLNYINCTVALPQPIKSSIETLKRHLYISPLELELATEVYINQYPYLGREKLLKEANDKSNHAETFYKIFLPILPNFIVNYEKFLLNTCNEHVSSNPNIQLDRYMFPNNSIGKIYNDLDLKRQKEIIQYHITHTFIFLIKKFKLNHYLQAETITREMFATHGIKLLLKLLNVNNMQNFIADTNEIYCLNPAIISCIDIKENSPENLHLIDTINIKSGISGIDKISTTSSAQINTSKIDIKNLLQIKNFWEKQVIAEGNDEQSEKYWSSSKDINLRHISWTNMTNAINIIRILVKITSKHQHRIWALDNFCKTNVEKSKSTSIFKRVLAVKQSVLQFYILKMVKGQIKFLGKPWKKNMTNMKLYGAIYRMLRHRLIDDWAYAPIPDNSYYFKNFHAWEKMLGFGWWFILVSF